MSEKVLYNKRMWLNPNSASFVWAKIENDYGYRNGSIVIGDDRRQINLDMNCDTKKTRDATIRKLQKLENIISECIAELENINYDG